MSKKYIEFQKITLPKSGIEVSISEISAFNILTCVGELMLFKLFKSVCYINGSLITDSDLHNMHPEDCGYMVTVLNCQISSFSRYA